MYLSPKTGSYDQMPSTFQPIFHSIINETPFKASKLFFNELVLHHENQKKKFLLYPRFVMQCIIKELGEGILLGESKILKPLTSQVFSSHNKPATVPADDQRENNPSLRNPHLQNPKRNPKSLNLSNKNLPTQRNK